MEKGRPVEELQLAGLWEYLSLFSRRQIQKGWRKNEVNMEHNENYFTEDAPFDSRRGWLTSLIVAHLISFSYFFFHFRKVKNLWKGDLKNKSKGYSDSINKCTVYGIGIRTNKLSTCSIHLVDGWISRSLIEHMLNFTLKILYITSTTLVWLMWWFSC